jgi:hypothetical protein
VPQITELRLGKALFYRFTEDRPGSMAQHFGLNQRGAAAIVTFNQRDFGVIPQQFGVEVLTPAVALGRIK